MQLATDARLAEQPLEPVGLAVIAADGKQRASGAERPHVLRQVGRAAGQLLRLLHRHHGYRRLGRDAFDVAVPVTIQHDIPHYQYLGAGYFFKELRQHFVYLSWSEGAFRDAPDVAGRYYPGIFRYWRLVPFQLILVAYP